MIYKRAAEDRGHFDHGWLKTYHSFSFADYYDPNFMGFRHLRVINEDWVAPGKGFGTHPHRDMEILTYILEGALEHKDSMGTGSVIRPGDVQRMSAGTGVTHSEFNPSDKERVHLLQIWIMPRERGLKPSYEQKAYTNDDKRGKLRLIASDDGADGSVTIQQDAKLYASIIAKGVALEHTLAAERRAWLQVARGGVVVNGITLAQGDAVAVGDEPLLTILGDADESEILLFDLS
jgi:redox-sensitive bicupin YhaK (pirin superfamily)